MKNSDRIERLIAKQQWERARTLIRAELKAEPNSHWLVARLALTHYEQRDYNKSLELELAGLQLEPKCPLLWWGYAGSCSMLGMNEKAIAAYDGLIKRGVDELAFGECGEGRGWARALVADCHFRRALCYERLNDRRKAREAIKKHLSVRGPGCRSIYTIAEARTVAARLGLKMA